MQLLSSWNVANVTGKLNFNELKLNRHMYLAVAVLDRKGLFYNSMRDTDEVGLHCAIPSTKMGFLHSFWVLSKYSLYVNINLITVHPFLAILSASPGPRAPMPGRPTHCSSMSKFEISPLTCPHLPVSVVLCVQFSLPGILFFPLATLAGLCLSVITGKSYQLAQTEFIAPFPWFSWWCGGNVKAQMSQGRLSDLCVNVCKEILKGNQARHGWGEEGREPGSVPSRSPTKGRICSGTL